MSVQDVDIETLKKKGWQMFRTTGDGMTIHPDDVEAFLEYARRPLTEEEKEYLRHCREVYEKMKKRSEEVEDDAKPE